jgi:hypothetical protein
MVSFESDEKTYNLIKFRKNQSRNKYLETYHEERGRVILNDFI